MIHADALLVALKESNVFSKTVPAKIQTYLAFGKPILGMLDGEGASIINEAGAGFACNAKKYDSLVENIIKMYQMDREEKQTMAENSKKYYMLHFERRMLFDRFEDEFKSLKISS